MVKEHLVSVVDRIVRVASRFGAMDTSDDAWNPDTGSPIDRSAGFDVFEDMRRVAFGSDYRFEDFEMDAEGGVASEHGTR